MELKEKAVDILSKTYDIVFGFEYFYENITRKELFTDKFDKYRFMYRFINFKTTKIFYPEDKIEVHSGGFPKNNEPVVYIFSSPKYDYKVKISVDKSLVMEIEIIK